MLVIMIYGCSSCFNWNSFHSFISWFLSFRFVATECCSHLLSLLLEHFVPLRFNLVSGSNVIQKFVSVFEFSFVEVFLSLLSKLNALLHGLSTNLLPHFNRHQRMEVGTEFWSSFSLVRTFFDALKLALDLPFLLLLCSPLLDGLLLGGA